MSMFQGSYFLLVTHFPPKAGPMNSEAKAARVKPGPYQSSPGASWLHLG